MECAGRGRGFLAWPGCSLKGASSQIPPTQVPPVPLPVTSSSSSEGKGDGCSILLSFTRSSTFCRSLEASTWDSSSSSPGKHSDQRGSHTWAAHAHQSQVPRWPGFHHGAGVGETSLGKSRQPELCVILPQRQEDCATGGMCATSWAPCIRPQCIMAFGPEWH